MLEAIGRTCFPILNRYPGGVKQRVFLSWTIIPSLLLLAFGCGSGRPTGAVADCRGYTRYQEGGGGATFNLGPGYIIGQYLKIARGTKVTGFMARFSATGLTGMRIGIYYGDPASPIQDLGNTLVKSFTITGNITTNGTEDVWFSLPEPFVFPELDDADRVKPYSYFVVFEPIGAGFSVAYGSVLDQFTRLRSGLRLGTAIQWSLSEPSLSMTIGYETRDGCE